MYGERIKQLRKTAGLNQAELALKIGVSRPNISFWENSPFPPLEAIYKICKALNVSMGEFFSDQEDRSDSIPSEELKALGQKMLFLDDEARSDLLDIFNNISQKFLKARMEDIQVGITNSQNSNMPNDNTREIQQTLEDISDKMKDRHLKNFTFDPYSAGFIQTKYLS
jgi:transcriptional regulator with XRE-family HTH domain